MAKISRRNFMRGAAMGTMGAAAAGLLTACGNTASSTTSAPASSAASSEAASAVTKPSSPVDGKYVTKAMGHESWVHVATTFFEGKITACEVLSHEETIGIGNYACSRIPAAIVANQSINVPNLRGSSITSMAVKAAVKEAIELAGYNVDDFSKEVTLETSNEVIEEEADVVIMGAGTSGLTCACRLLEAGYSVILVEKRDIPGGSMSMTYSGLACAGSQLQKNYSLGRFDSSPFFDKDAMLGVLKGLVIPENDRFDGAMPYDDALYTTSPALVDWLHEIGVGFYSMGVNKAYGVTPYLAPGCYEGGCGYAMQYLVDRIGALGGTIIYGAKVTDITMTEGRATGLVAEGKGGETYTATAKAVLLASGGFGANQEMVDEYYPQYKGRSFNCCPASTGDGIVLGQKVGAGIECMGRELGAYMSTTAQAGSRMEIAFMYQTTPGIMVNASGDQFGNVMSANHYVIGRALCDDANGGKFFWITDESGAVTTMNNLTYAFDTYKAVFERGDMVHYATVEEAAEALGLSNLQQTLDTHNAHALAGEEDEFKRKKLPYIDTHDGVWVCGIEPTFYLTTGGLAIDTSAHVLTDDGSTIAGLYAAGDVCGSVEEKDGKQYGMGFDAAMNFGYIMAETVASEIA